MKSSFKRKLTLFFLITLFFIGALLPFSGKISAKAYTDPYSYEVASYEVVMDVRSDRTVFVEEKIEVFFTGYDSHGIIRDIPCDDVYIRNIKANATTDDFVYFLADEIDGLLSVYLRGEDVVTGKTITYSLSYEYITPVGKSGEDAISLNIIGYGWSQELNNVTATFILPFEPVQTQYFSGKNGSSSNNYATVTENFSSNGYTVTLKADNLPLVGYSDGVMTAAGITGAFVFESGLLSERENLFLLKASDFLKVDYVALIYLAIAGIGAVVCVYMCMSRKREKTLIPVVTFNPPLNLDPLKIGKYFDGTVDDKDVFSLVYYLAANGYLKIEIDGKKGEKTYLHRTVKSFENDVPRYARDFYSALFASSELVEVEQLGEKFYEKMSGIKGALEADKTLPSSLPMYDKEGDERANKITGATFVFQLIAIIALLVIGLINYKSLLFDTYYFFTVIICIGIAVFQNIIIAAADRHKGFKFSSTLLKTVGSSVICLAIAALLCIFMRGNYPLAVFAIICNGACAMANKLCVIRSDEYITLLGDIEGFRNFILYTEKDRIEMLLEEEPQLFYNILPYAQVMGVSDKWEDKFKDIPLPEAEWISYSPSYRGIRNYYICSRIMRSFNDGYSRYVAEQAAKASKGVGGGGSFSGGGGFGGGGGRGC